METAPSDEIHKGFNVILSRVTDRQWSQILHQTFSAYKGRAISMNHGSTILGERTCRLENGSF